MLGRWKPDGSDTYLRMYNGVVSRLQLQFARVARTGERSRTLDERDVIESAMPWITDRCDQLSDDRVQGVLQHLQTSMECEVQQEWNEVEEEVPDVASLFGPLVEDISDTEDRTSGSKVERKSRGCRCLWWSTMEADATAS